MSRKMCYWGLVDPASCVDIDGVYYLVRRPVAFVLSGMRDRVLPSWSKQETSILSERQPPEERGQGFISVDVCVLDSQSMSWFRGRLHGHNSRKRH